MTVLPHTSHNHPVGTYSAACPTCREHPPLSKDSVRVAVTVEDRFTPAVVAMEAAWRLSMPWWRRPIPPNKLWSLLFALMLLGHAWLTAGGYIAGLLLLLIALVIALVEVSGGMPPEIPGRVTSRENPHAQVDRRRWVR